MLEIAGMLLAGLVLGIGYALGKRAVDATLGPEDSEKKQEQAPTQTQKAEA